jgi:hypothetical protein
MRIFVIWDMTIPNLSADLVALKAHPKLADTALEMMGPDLYTEDDALQRIRAHLEHPETAGALAVLDEANADVGFQVGLALALQRPVALLTQRTAHRASADRPPLNGLLQPPRSFDAATVAETVQRLRDGGPGAWCHLPERPTGGDGVLLLWPEGRRGELYEGALPPASPRRLPVDGWALDGLPRQLTGVGRVVWVVPQPEPGERDGGENARLAVVAGYCHGLGVELHVLVEEPPDPAARALVDLHGLRKAWYGVEQLRELLAGLLQPGPRPAPDALVAWRAWLRRRHADLIPFAPGMTEPVLPRVVVELRPQRRGEGPAQQDHTLRSLLELLSRPGQIGRVLVRAGPGAGKTTAARHVAWQMGADDARHVVVLVPLVELGARSPLQHAEQQSGIEGLAARLADEAKVPGRLWLLLDGLDEVGLSATSTSTLATIRALATSPAWAGVVLVVLGRDVVLPPRSPARALGAGHPAAPRRPPAAAAAAPPRARRRPGRPAPRPHPPLARPRRAGGQPAPAHAAGRGRPVRPAAPRPVCAVDPRRAVPPGGGPAAGGRPPRAEDPRALPPRRPRRAGGPRAGAGGRRRDLGRPHPGRGPAARGGGGPRDRRSGRTDLGRGARGPAG